MKKLIFIAAICLAFVSCKKDMPAPPPPLPFQTIKFAQGAFDYVNLAEGKYFIYRDSSTGTTDSVVVTISKLQIIRMPAISGGYTYLPERDVQKFELKLMSYVGTSPSVWLHGSDNTENHIFYTTSDTVPMNLKSDYPSISYFKYFDYQKLESYPSMIVEGINYDNVITIVSEFGSDISNPIYKKTTCYWAKGIGIIKRQTITMGNNIKTETLLRYN